MPQIDAVTVLNFVTEALLSGKSGPITFEGSFLPAAGGFWNWLNSFESDWMQSPKRAQKYVNSGTLFMVVTNKSIGNTAEFYILPDRRVFVRLMHGTQMLGANLYKAANLRMLDVYDQAALEFRQIA